jgi:hypothetical protein
MFFSFYQAPWRAHDSSGFSSVSLCLENNAIRTSEASKSLINKAHKLQLGIKKIQLYFLYSRKMISKRSEISFAHGGGIPPPHYSMLSTTPFLPIQEGREARKPCRPFPSSTGPASASPCSRCGLLFGPLVVSRGLSSGCLPGAP